jgi:hypothetical protein
LWCYEFDFTAGNGGFVATPTGRAAYSAGVGWVAASGYVQIRKTFTSADLVEATLWTATNPDNGRCSARANSYDGAVFDIPQDSYAMDGALYKRVFSLGNKTASGIWFTADNSGGGCTMVKIRLKGTGTNPFGTDNCT